MDLDIHRVVLRAPAEKSFIPTAEPGQDLTLEQHQPAAQRTISPDWVRSSAVAPKLGSPSMATEITMVELRDQNTTTSAMADLDDTELLGFDRFGPDEEDRSKQAKGAAFNKRGLELPIEPKLPSAG